MITRFAILSSRLAVLFAFVLTLAACGGGGGGGGGFLGPGEEDTPLEVSTSGLPAAAAGTSYTALVEATGGKEPYSWAVVDDGGTGFEVNDEGFLTGIAPEKGEYGITLEVTDNANQKERFSTILSVVEGPESLAIANTALPVALDGIEYTALIQARGGKEPYTWAILNDGGTGFTIDNEGFLTGIGPATGQYGMTLEVTDELGATAKSSLILTVAGDAPQPLSIATETLPNAEEGKAYNAILQAVGGQGDYMWVLTDGGGTGLQLRDDGLLNGDAPDQGQYALTVAVQDDTRSVTSTLLLNVSADSSPLNITTSSLPAGTAGERYAAVLAASGGDEPYTWTLLSSGGLLGITVSSEGILSGTPSTPGTFGLVVGVGDGNQTDEQALTLTISPEPGAEEPLKITTTDLPDADRALYAAAVTATGGVQPYTWTGGDTSTPGTGFTVTPSTGSITGNTNNLLPGQYGYTVTVRDSLGDTDTQSFVITVPGGDTPPVRILTENPLPTAYEGLFYTTILRATGGTGNATLEWSVIDTAGFPGIAPSFATEVDKANGVLTWNAENIVAGNYLVTIQVNDSQDSDVFTFDLQASAAPVRITTDNPLPGAIEGVAYTRTMAVSGGGVDNTWTVLSVTRDGSAYTGGPAFVGTGIKDGTLTWSAADIERGNYLVEVEVVSKDAQGVASSDTKTFNLEALPATP